MNSKTNEAQLAPRLEMFQKWSSRVSMVTNTRVRFSPSFLEVKKSTNLLENKQEQFAMCATPGMLLSEKHRLRFFFFLWSLCVWNGGGSKYGPIGQTPVPQLVKISVHIPAGFLDWKMRSRQESPHPGPEMEIWSLSPQGDTKPYTQTKGHKEEMHSVSIRMTPFV